MFYDIIQQKQPFPVPLSEATLHQLAQKCHITPATRMLDLQCVRGELLCQWAHHYDLKGTGVDDHAPHIRQASERANELEVWANLHFVESDVDDYPQAFHQYHIVAHLGDTRRPIHEHIASLRTAIHDEQGGYLLLGQLFWQIPPPEHICNALGIEPDMLPALGDFIATLHAQNIDMTDFVLATPQDWDAFYTHQWRIIQQWLDTHPTHAQYDDVQTQRRQAQYNYFRYERAYLGWGVFILPIAPNQQPDATGDYGDW